MLEQVEEVANEEELLTVRSVLLVDCQYFDVGSTATAVKSVDDDELSSGSLPPQFGQCSFSTTNDHTWCQIIYVN